jgi:hypothetical protein
MAYTREVLPKRKLTSLHLLVQLSSFYIENIIHLFSEISYLNEEVNCTEASPSVSILCLLHDGIQHNQGILTDGDG